LNEIDRLPRRRRGRNSAGIFGGRAKIPSPKTPSFLPARFCPLRGRAADFYYNIKSAQFSKELSLKSLLVFSKQTQRPR